MFRPTSIFVLPITFLCIFFKYFYLTNNSKQMNFLIFSSLVIFCCIAFLFSHYDDLSFLSERLNHYKDLNLDGVVVHDRWGVDFDINNISNYFYYL